MELFGLYNYWVFAVLLMVGFYAVIAKRNMIKKLLGLQNSGAADSRDGQKKRKL